MDNSNGHKIVIQLKKIKRRFKLIENHIHEENPAKENENDVKIQSELNVKFSDSTLVFHITGSSYAEFSSVLSLRRTKQLLCSPPHRPTPSPHLFL